MGEITQALGNLANPTYWIAVTVAVLVASATGIIPGASGVLIMALSIPFIVEYFREDPAIGLVMLASMTGVNNTLDSIPAILLGQPGAATQVTFLEGHQLARQGKAAHTLGAVYGVSMFGGIIGALTLMALVPIIKPFILKFGFGEIAAMAFFGIAMVSALSSGAMIKGLAAGALGILFGTVGINAISGEARFVFNQPPLWSGLPLISTTLGLFALPEMIDLSMTRRPVAPPNAVINTREVFRGTIDGLRRWKVMIRQSLFGVLMGAVPGVGAAVIDWLSYAFGIFFAKDKSQFGKGSLDGVLFAESAQNSKEAGQAIPTLALGVPGGLAWAIVLIAMIAMDMAPGPRLLGDLADVTILLVVTLAIANVMVTALGIVFTGQLAKLTRIPYPMIAGVIIPISLLSGVFNMTNWLALPIMLVFMAIGLTMKLFQWPRPPLLLGIILGPIIERNLQSAQSGPNGYLGVATSPLVIFLVVTAIGTAYFFWRSGEKELERQRAVAQTQADEPGIAGASDTEPRAAAASLVSAAVQLRNVPAFLAIGCGVAFIIGSSGFTPTGYFLPRLMSILIIGLASLQIFWHIKNRNAEKVDIMDLGMHSLAIPGSKQAGVFIAVGLAGFMILAGIIGLRWAAMVLAVYLPASLMPNGKWRILGPVIAGALVSAFQFGMADNLLNPIWPEAGLFDWLGRMF
jgi:TctA family transporter